MFFFQRKEVGFRTGKRITAWSFDVPPYRDFVVLVIFHDRISRKIRTELDSTGRSAPRRVERSNGMRNFFGYCVKLVAGPARSSRTRKELSHSQRALDLKKHELLAAVVVKSTTKYTF